MQEVKHRFVGIDPYIESQCWEDFHLEMASSIRAQLLLQLLPRGYDASLEQRVYLEYHDPEHTRRAIRPDIAIHTEGRMFSSSGGVALLDPATEVEIAAVAVPMPEERRVPYIAVHKMPERELVTVIELLLPTNKNPDTDGYRVYHEKRAQLLESLVHLVEIDLLRKGMRLPTVDPPSAADYYAYISRSEERPTIIVIGWKLNSRMPRIPIPLLAGDPDAVLDLQAAYEDAFARARYDLRLNYEQPLE